MRVAHVTPTGFGSDGSYGGGERYPAELARAMSRLTPTRLVRFGARSGRTFEDGLEVRTLASRGRFRGAEVNQLSAALVGALSDVDVVHVHCWDSVLANACVLLGRVRGQRVFATDHGGSGHNYWRRLHLNRLLTGFLAVSEFGAGRYPELSDRTTVIYGGTDHHHFRPGPSAPRHGAVFVGRLLPHKGIDQLISGLPADLPLRVIGRPYHPTYRECLHDLAAGKRVTFEENASDDDVVAAYRSARVAVLPSQYRPLNSAPSPNPELLGLTLIEAMACGTPVVCTDVGGMPEVVESGVTGLVVEPLNPQALGAAVHRLASDDAAWSVMAANARRTVERRFTWSAVAERCLDAYAGHSRGS